MAGPDVSESVVGGGRMYTEPNDINREVTLSSHTFSKMALKYSFTLSTSCNLWYSVADYQQIWIF